MFFLFMVYMSYYSMNYAWLILYRNFVWFLVAIMPAQISNIISSSASSAVIHLEPRSCLRNAAYVYAYRVNCCTGPSCIGKYQLAHSHTCVDVVCINAVNIITEHVMLNKLPVNYSLNDLHCLAC